MESAPDPGPWRVSVLGPVTVAGQVHLAPKPRALLAGLLARPNVTVSADQLVDAIWGDAPPRSATGSLRSYLHHVRVAVGPDRLRREPSGFVLVVRRDELDAYRFEDLAAAGRAALATGDRRRGRELLTAALRLWRGPAFDGQRGLALVAEEAARLDELRYAVTLDRIDAELIDADLTNAGLTNANLTVVESPAVETIDAEPLARVAAMRDELIGLVAEFPFREDIRSRLMVAHYRLGDADAALASYAEGRDILSTERGLDPGPRLRRLATSITAGVDAEELLRTELATFASKRADVVSAAGETPVNASTDSIADSGSSEENRRAATDPGDNSGAVPRTGGDSVPNELPHGSRTFTGREREKKMLREHLTAPAQSASISGLPMRDGSTRRAAVLTGAGGVGKSALAAHIAHQVADGFPDGQLYVNLHGSTPDVVRPTLVEVLARFLRSLRVGATAIPTDPVAAAALYAELTQQRRILVVLDNVAVDSAAIDSAAIEYGALDSVALDDAGLVDADIPESSPSADDSSVGERISLADLLPSGPGCGVVLTSRRALSVPDAVSLHLDVLPEPDAIDLLARIIGTERLAAEPDAAADVARRCGCLPLALSIAGARLAARPDTDIRVFADRLAAHRQRLSELAVEDLGVRSSFLISYRDLADSGAARVFRLLGLLDGPDFGVPVVAALTGLPPARAGELLTELVAARLVEFRTTEDDAAGTDSTAETPTETPAENPADASTSAGRYALHDLLRLFARELVEESETATSRSAASDRAFDWYLESAVAATRVVAPAYEWRLKLAAAAHSNTAHSNTARSNTAHSNTVHSNTARSNAAHSDAVESGVNSGSGVSLSSTAEVTAWLESERQNLLAVAQQAADGADPARTVRLSAAVHMVLEYRGRWWDQYALARISGRAAERTGSAAHRGLAANDRGWALLMLRRVPPAVDLLSTALRTWREIGHADGEALALHGIGAAYRSLGRLEESLASLSEAAAVAHRAGNAHREAACQTATGLTYHHLGRYRQAAAAHGRGVELAREMGLWHTEVVSLGNLAESLRLAGEYDGAAERFAEALRVGKARNYGGTYWEAEHLWGLGRSRHALGLDGRECWLASARVLHTLGLISTDQRATIERDPTPETPAVIAEQL